MTSRTLPSATRHPVNGRRAAMPRAASPWLRHALLGLAMAGGLGALGAAGSALAQAATEPEAAPQADATPGPDAAAPVSSTVVITARALPRIQLTPRGTAQAAQATAATAATAASAPADGGPSAALAPSQVSPAPAQAAALPTAVQLAAAAPGAARGAGEPRFDLSVNNAPAAQVFLQLAQGTAYNMLVSPEVSGTLSITLKDTSVPEALDTLRELFGYDFRIAGNRIFVYSNAVQTRLYRVNYLPGRRQGESDLRVTSSAISQSVSSGNGSSGGGGSTGGGSLQRPNDNAQVRTTSDANFWQEVQASLTAMVGSQGGRSVVLNPAAGVVVVRATPAELRQVENYLKAVQLAIERQVMLEAKIIEVVLSKDAQSGINWAGFGKLPGSNTRFSVGTAAPGTTLSGNASVPLTSADGTRIAPGVDMAAGSLGRGFYGLAFQAANFAALLNFLETQGNVQVLSSPRIATLNNQKAVLKVGSDELYVTGITSSTTTAGNNAVSSPSVTLQPFFSGISLDVTPQIDEAGNVMLHVHPTISVVTEKSKNIDLGALGNYKLPLAASTVNETDSIVRVRDGQIVAIGGLMKQETHNERTGMPVLGDAPVVGHLFRQTSAVTSKRELVILLKPSVIQHDGPWPEAMPPDAVATR